MNARIYLSLSLLLGRFQRSVCALEMVELTLSWPADGQMMTKRKEAMATTR